MTDKAASTSATERVAHYAAIVSFKSLLLLSGGPLIAVVRYSIHMMCRRPTADRNGLDVARLHAIFFGFEC